MSLPLLLPAATTPCRRAPDVGKTQAPQIFAEPTAAPGQNEPSPCTCVARTPSCSMIALCSLRQGRLGLAAMLATLAAALPDARAHDWYPFECCSARDCAPADNVVRREDGGYMITARGITVLVPWWFRPWRESPDGRVHICFRQFAGIGPVVLCAFRGPGA